MGPVSFDPGVIWKKRVGAISDDQRCREFFCEQCKPYHSGEVCVPKTLSVLIGKGIT